MTPQLSKILIPYKAIGNSSLRGEQLMCVEFANDMRARTLSCDLPYVWFHIANEFLPSTRVNYSFDLKLKHMGKISGLPDYCFVGNGDNFFIEFKMPKGKQSESQKIFEEWCGGVQVEYHVCYSAKDGIDLVETKKRRFKNLSRSSTEIFTNSH